jgi:hypothetical protein
MACWPVSRSLLNTLLESAKRAARIAACVAYSLYGSSRAGLMSRCGQDERKTKFRYRHQIPATCRHAVQRLEMPSQPSRYVCIDHVGPGYTKMHTVYLPSERSI